MRRTVFVDGRGDLRSGWWLAVFLLVLIAFLVPLIAWAAQEGTGVPLWHQAAAVAAASLVAQALRRRPIGELFGPFGWCWLRDFSTGSTLGAGLMAVPAVALGSAGAIRFDRHGIGVDALWQLCAVYVLVAVTEELMFRGFAFQRLVDGLGAWTAQFIGASFFLLTHSDALRGAGVLGPLGAANIFAASILFGMAWLRTRSLAMPIGLHFGANVMQGAVLGLGVSGNQVHGWLTPVLMGPEWLTGGAFGLEASAPGLLCVVLPLLVLRRRL